MTQKQIPFPDASLGLVVSTLSARHPWAAVANHRVGFAKLMGIWYN